MISGICLKMCLGIKIVLDIFLKKQNKKKKKTTKKQINKQKQPFTS
jgi:hypothetical protein